MKRFFDLLGRIYRRVKSLIVVDRVEPSKVDEYIAGRQAALAEPEPPEAPSEPVERLADYWVPTTELEIEQATTIDGATEPDAARAFADQEIKSASVSTKRDGAPESEPS